MSATLVTGGTGFVGRHFVERLRHDGVEVRLAGRAPRDGSAHPAAMNVVPIGSIGSDTDWTAALDGVDRVVHLAGRAHVLEEQVADPLPVFLEVNCAGTLRLAESAAQRGVRRFVFVSSVKVNGEDSSRAKYSASDESAPVDPYGVSKMRAELGLEDLARRTGMEVTIVRPPLVYGPGVGANFLRLMSLVDKGVPLPLGSVRNLRSMVSLWNLSDLLVRCLDAPTAANRTFMVSDGRDLSTAELVGLLAAALGKQPRVFDFPPVMLRTAARLTGKLAEYTRLCASLHVDTSATTATLNWNPPLSVEESIARTVRWYRSR